MKRFTAGIVVLLFIACIAQDGIAQLRLPALFADNMVLQQKTDAAFWGWAGPGSAVTVTGSWDKKPVTAPVDKSGKWMATLKTPFAGGPYTVRINDTEIKNVLIGEVWLCSGQSNMEYTIKMLGGWDLSYFTGMKKEFESRKFSQLRLFNVKNYISDQAQDDCEGTWQLSTPETVEPFSAVAFCYGWELYKKLKVPVALISSEWGGTPAESWTNPAELKKHEEFDFYFQKEYRKDTPWKPGRLYNGMIHPLIPYAIAGAIWYQGESNRLVSHIYKNLFSVMVNNWRQEWGRGQFPFYYVQIAPFNYNRPVVGALLREAQLKAMDIPNSGMAVTMDIGNNDNIHPKNKPEVGKRLALWAFHDIYGYGSTEPSGPVYSHYLIEGNSIRLYFSHAEHGLNLKYTQEPEFFIAGTDRVFYPAEVTIRNNMLLVSSNKVPEPVACRYAFTNTSAGILFNNEGFPASSFRTDDWPFYFGQVTIKKVLNKSHSGTFLFEMQCDDPDAEIKYTTDGAEPDESALLYNGPIRIKKDATIMARAFSNGIGSELTAKTNVIYHLGAQAADVQLNSQLAKRYRGSGKFTLIDGIAASPAVSDRAWQGFEGNDLDYLIEFDTPVTLSSVTIRALQDMPRWVFLPKYIKISCSLDNREFISIGSGAYETALKNESGAAIKTYTFPARNRKVKYLHIIARNTGICPAWHPGAGRKAWMFLDEIILK